MTTGGLEKRSQINRDHKLLSDEFTLTHSSGKKIIISNGKTVKWVLEILSVSLNFQSHQLTGPPPSKITPHFLSKTLYDQKGHVLLTRDFFYFQPPPAYFSSAPSHTETYSHSANQTSSHNNSKYWQLCFC